MNNARRMIALQAAAPPAWIELIAAGVFSGRDGRGRVEASGALRGAFARRDRALRAGICESRSFGPKAAAQRR